MFKAFKRWLAKAAYDGLQGGNEALESARINKLHSIFQSSMAEMVVFKIDNGFVVRITDSDMFYKGVHSSGFVYCADYQAIIDYIVSSATKQKLGVQPDMSEKEKQGAFDQYAVPHQSRGKTATK